MVTQLLRINDAVEVQFGLCTSEETVESMNKEDDANDYDESL